MKANETAKGKGRARVRANGRETSEGKRKVRSKEKLASLGGLEGPPDPPPKTSNKTN